MPRPSLRDALQACAAWLPEPFLQDHARLFADEHLEHLAARLSQCHDCGVPAVPPPHFAAECTPPLAPAWQPFREPVRAWHTAADPCAPELLQAFAAALVAAGTDGLLLLLGQRRTPASVTDARGLPPTRAELLTAAERRHRDDDPLTVVGRALAKHVNRNTGAFWGDVRGPAAVINERARTLLRRILDGATWWNVFGHFQHELVYEARLPSGHGARWELPELDFVGFLEPFAEDQCPSLQGE